MVCNLRLQRCRLYKIYTTRSFHHPDVASSKSPPATYSETLSMYVLLLRDHTPIFTPIKTGKSSSVYFIPYRDMRRLTTGIRPEKCVVRRFRRCANVIVYLHKPRQYSIAYYTPRLYGIAYCCRLQTCTACYCTEYCRQL